ncbi:ABC transporter ATP-binding protein [Microbacterium sp. MPKO10]|uniref:ABC transporter ATP-binding protein n=1 Tax=Microbacterium sp. MPKO10 TaxID=2989818 RepID=UPI0022359DA6|nr:ABC transporter ATP-binding protein [Microbacterium sp. MPKO10]MCW4456966.1 ABC transporter ATP-binding protein [Microbacterium sp. MPKO10]
MTPHSAPPSRTPVISVSDLRMSYGDKTVLDGIQLDIHEYEIVAMLGPNGAGKSTTIEILEGFRTPSSGSVSVLGSDPVHGDDGWRSQIGIVLQTSSDHGKWRPRQLLTHLSDFYEPYVDPWPVDELLEMVGLQEQANQKLQTLSGGQRRRLDVAMAIVGKPSLLFLDEPTTGFDPRARRDFHELIHRLSDIGDITIMLTTHDLAEAEALASRIVILAGGGIIADGTPFELTKSVSRTAEISWQENGQHQLHTAEDSTQFVRELLAHNDDVTDLEIRRATLEDAYLSLVEKFEAGHDVGQTHFEEVVK